MQDQDRRDAKTITIGTGLAPGAGVLLLGLVLLGLADRFFGVPQKGQSVVLVVSEVAAVVVLVAYVAWNRRR